MTHPNEKISPSIKKNFVNPQKLVSA